MVNYVTDLRSKLTSVQVAARANEEKAKAKMKVWYDRIRQFEEGDMVLVLLPSLSNKLKAEWQGLYAIVRKVTPVTYQVRMSDKKKSLRVLHVNMLMAWTTPNATCLYAGHVDPSDYTL